jgi:V8-like Glu-specific endopeptidase
VRSPATPPRRAATAAAAFALTAAVAATALTGASAASASAATAATHAKSPASPHGTISAITHAVTATAQRSTRAFWTPKAMAAATPLVVAEPQSASTPAAPPSKRPPIPHPTPFNGVPTVGALFFTTGKTQKHFCTASVVNSLTGNLVLTAAHCVYGSSAATNIEYVPEYHDGLQPYGSWPVQTVTVAAGWQQGHNPNLDFAFLRVTPPSGTYLPIQYVTGGLWLGVNQGYTHPIFVIGLNDVSQLPIGCATHSFEFEASQQQFYCAAYWNGTSGGPWITNYNPATGSGTVIGVIGGYEEGGLVPWTSYSAYFGWPTLQLFLKAQLQQA